MKSFLLAALLLTVSLPGSSILLAADAPPPAVNLPNGIKHKAFDVLLKKYVNAEGLVNYKDWKANAADMKALDDYLGQYAPKPDQPAEGDELIASAINAYNAFGIRWILSNYPTESILALKDSFEAKRHQIGGETVSLEAIEHGTLRPKIGWRVHSAIVCCARSCPPLQKSAYLPETVNAQIDAAYKAWLAREDLNKFVPAEKKVEISSIFKWFEADFKSGGGIGGILTKFAPEAYRQFLGSNDFKIEYMKYHWGLNDAAGQGKDYSGADKFWDSITGRFK